MPIEVLSPRILSLKSRQDQLTAAREEAESQLEQRRAELPTSKEIKGYVADFRELFQEGTFPERKALIRNFVQGIEIVEDEAVLTYTIPMPSDGVMSESASVLDFVQSGPPHGTRTNHPEKSGIAELPLGSLTLPLPAAPQDPALVPGKSGWSEWNDGPATG